MVRVASGQAGRWTLVLAGIYLAQVGMRCRRTNGLRLDFLQLAILRDHMLTTTPKMKKFLHAAAAATGDAGYAVPAEDKRQAAMARAYCFGEVIDIGKHRRFIINQAGRDALAQQ
jgi:hypothetical protein